MSVKVLQVFSHLFFVVAEKKFVLESNHNTLFILEEVGHNGYIVVQSALLINDLLDDIWKENAQDSWVNKK